MGMMRGGAGGATGKSEEVFYLKTEGQQYKVLPIKMTVLVDQSRLPDFLVGLENSPMAIQVMEAEISKPLTPVTKPIFGDKSTYAGMEGGGMGMGPMGMPGGMMPGGRGMMGGGPGGMSRPGEAGMMPGMMPGMMGGPGGGAAVKKGTDVRNAPNKAAERLKAKKDESKTKGEPKNKLDQYYNVIEVTVYGQARFYLAPPAPPEPPPSTASTALGAPKAEATEPEPAKPAEAAPKDEATKKDEPAKPDAPKAEAAAPKEGDGPKPDPSTTKSDAPKADAPKGDAPPPKS